MKITSIKLNKHQWIVVILVGILLLVIAIPTGTGTIETTQEDGKKGDTIETSYDGDYEELLENRLVTILEQIDGAGQVQAMITLQDQGESVVEKDITSESDIQKEADGAQNTTSSSQKTTVYSAEKNPYEAKELMPKVEGILVVAQGGGSPKVQREIYDALLALFSVEAHKIKIVKMEMQEGQ